MASELGAGTVDRQSSRVKSLSKRERRRRSSNPSRAGSFGSHVDSCADVVQLAGIDHIQAFLTHALKAGHDLIYGCLHYAMTPFVSREIKIEMLSHETIGEAGETIQWILNAVPK